MRFWARAALAPAALLLLAAAPAPFDAKAAWAEFETLVRLDYGNGQRPGIDAEAILAAFRAQALDAADAASLRQVMKLAAWNFADPHFGVGPRAAGDPGLVPTASDIDAGFIGRRAVVRDVRLGSAAETAGLVPGAEIRSIDGRAPEAAVEYRLGRRFGTLSAAQAEYGLALALAGARDEPRAIAVRQVGSEQLLALPSAGVQAREIAARAPVSSEQLGDIGIIRINNSLGRMETIVAFRAALAALQASPVLILDLRNTPSGGNTTVARGIMGHFTDRAQPYQVHEVPSEARRWGAPRKFVELLLPVAPRYRGRLMVLAGRWTGSMGEGMVTGLDAAGHETIGSAMGGLLGALWTEELALSGARVEFGGELLFHPDGRPRGEVRPRRVVTPADHGDAAMGAALRLGAQ